MYASVKNRAGKGFKEQDVSHYAWNRNRTCVISCIIPDKLLESDTGPGKFGSNKSHD